MQLDISRTFYDLDLLKFPLTIDVSVSHVGRSSSRRCYKICQLSQPDNPCVTCSIDDVIVDKHTRKPAAFPKWWEEKYSYLKSSKPKLTVQEPTNSHKVLTDQFTVDVEHIDHNGHTTTSAYVRFCFNAIYRTMQKANFSSETVENLRNGTKTLTVLFHKESSIGDILTVESWECRPGQLNFHIKNSSNVLCCSMSVLLHKSSENLGKSRM